MLLHSVFRGGSFIFSTNNNYYFFVLSFLLSTSSVRSARSFTGSSYFITIHPRVRCARLLLLLHMYIIYEIRMHDSICSATRSSCFSPLHAQLAILLLRLAHTASHIAPHRRPKWKIYVFLCCFFFQIRTNRVHFNRMLGQKMPFPHDFRWISVARMKSMGQFLNFHYSTLVMELRNFSISNRDFLNCASNRFLGYLNRCVTVPKTLPRHQHRRQ